MRTKEEVKQVLLLIANGKNDCEISRLLNIPRSTVKGWRHGEVPKEKESENLNIHEYLEKRGAAYSYILGEYLGDGHITRTANGRTVKIRIFNDRKYPLINKEIEKNLSILLPLNKVSIYYIGNCSIIYVHSNILPLLFPRSLEPGVKYKRKIFLEEWQLKIVNEYPKEFFKGLIQSDGSRYLISKKYNHYAYNFSNKSQDIVDYLLLVSRKLNLKPTQTVSKTGVIRIYFYKREDVAFIDTFIGPKK